MLVAAGISATGLEGFQPWSATKQVIVAADRDEGTKDDGRPRDRRGEHAARNLCLRLRETVVCGIALPGVAGEKIDWLDILRRDGIDAVRNGVLAAVPFEPTAEELERAAGHRQQAAERDEIADAYPLPRTHTLDLTYARTKAGKIMVHQVIHSREGRKLIPIATPFGVLARLRHVNQTDDYGLRCVVQDMSGKPRTIDFDRALLPNMGARDIRSMLFKAGLRTEGDGDSLVVQVLKAADSEREIMIVSRPGWHEIEGSPDPIFVGPDGTVIGVPAGIDVELAASVRLSPEASRAGTSDNWRAAASIALGVPDCLHWTIGLVSGFVGPLISLTNFPSCGVNLSGLSTSGKSTGQRLAVSCWSSPDVRRDGLFQTRTSPGPRWSRWRSEPAGRFSP